MESPTHVTWMTRTAIAATIGTTLSAITTFFLKLLLFSTYDEIAGRTEAEIREFLLRDAITVALRDGLCFGLFLGLSLALAWSSLVVTTTKAERRWITATIISTLLAIPTADLVITLGMWSYGRSILIPALGGALAGLIMGVTQSFVVWSSSRARFLWIMIQTFAFAGVFVIMDYANRGISNVLLFPFVWLAMWGIYGRFMGYVFEETRYNLSDE